MSSSRKKYEYLYEQYDLWISKEQLYKICHISKRTANYLLESGLIPCKKSGKKTHKYSIALHDVVTYLIERDIYPIKFKPSRHAALAKNRNFLPSLHGFEEQDYFSRLLAPYPDVLRISDVQEITKYARSTIVAWCDSGALSCLTVGRSYRVPKPFLMNYLISERFRNITKKSARHLEMLREIEEMENMT